jgi:hypothetical protein
MRYHACSDGWVKSREERQFGRGTSRTGDDDRRRMIALVADSTTCFQRRGAFRVAVLSEPWST